LHPNLHFSQRYQPKLIGQRHISRITAIGDRDAVAPWFGLGRVKAIPAIAHKGFKPSVEVHRVELVEVAHHHPSGNRQAAAKGHAQVDKITADPLAGLLGVNGRGGGIAGVVPIVNVVVNPTANGTDLVIA
jgi:hypothetical protein